MNGRFCLSGNALKIIAAISMLVDHIGLIFFPQFKLFRIVGRIALPIFAFMIAEGCRYTKNRLRYFFTVLLLATAFQTVYFIYNGDVYMSILVTFSISMLNIYALQFFKEELFDIRSSLTKKLLSASVILGVIVATYLLNVFLEIDYGFYGCLLPIFPAVFHPLKRGNNDFLKKFDTPVISVLALCVGMLLLALNYSHNQFWAFLALPFLLCYSGKRGKANIKYFFYIFYPAHLLILELINLLI